MYLHTPLPASKRSNPPKFAETLAVRRLMSRFGISASLASTIAALAGIGGAQ